MYRIARRDSDGFAKDVGTVLSNGNIISKEAEKIELMFKNLKVRGEPFDAKNPKHLPMLPILLNGRYVYAYKVEKADK